MTWRCGNGASRCLIVKTRRAAVAFTRVPSGRPPPVWTGSRTFSERISDIECCFSQQLNASDLSQNRTVLIHRPNIHQNFNVKEAFSERSERGLPGPSISHFLGTIALANIGRHLGRTMTNEAMGCSLPRTRPRRCAAPAQGSHRS
jgi:hypothetical protein